MPTSSYMPDVKVEIAFDSGFGTAAASRTWTDVSTYVELDRGLTITFGRQDERSTADANQLTLTFDNRDGRFTPGNSSGAYYPNVKLYRPIRVTATPVDGSAQVEFVGYINEWPLSWDDGIDATNYVTVTASSRLARLGTVTALSNIVSTAILADSPVAYYTLGEPDGATQAFDSSGTEQLPLVQRGDGAAVVFGDATGPGTDGLTAAQFADGQYLIDETANSDTSFTLECFFLRDPSVASRETMISGLVGIWLDSSGLLTAGVGGATVQTAARYDDGATHHAAITCTASSGTVTLYADGVLVGSVLIGALSTPQSQLVVGSGFTGVVAHAALFSSVLTAGQIAAHAEAGLTGFAGDTADARLERYAGYAGIPAAEVNAEVSSVGLAHIDTTDQQVVEMMRKVEAAEGGVLFDDRDGTLAFHTRGHRYLSSSSFTLNMNSHMVEADYAPKVDGSYVLNDVNAANLDGTVTAHKLDSTSITDYGLNHADIETADQDDDAPLMAASWTVYKYKDPKERTATLAVVATEQVGKTPNCATVMAANVGDKITVSNRPTQIKPASVDYFVEGYTRTYSQESLVTVFNVSPSSPDDQVLKIGDATRGVIGTNPVAF